MVISSKFLNRLKKELCGICDNSIKIGNVTAPCKICNMMFHLKCSNKENNHKIVNGNYFCSACSNSCAIKYNPFKKLFDSDYSDKFYDNEPPEIAEHLELISEVLENCRCYTRHEFSDMLSEKLDADRKEIFSTLFFNIDGNRTNFDIFAAELHTLKYDFSVVGLAKTNINESQCFLYGLSPNYRAVYQSAVEDKSKGSGLALYVRNEFNFKHNNELSTCSDDLEALFITITNLGKPITVGVVYRPPSGNLEKFLTQFENMLEQLPANSYVLGDFNIDLHDMLPKSHQTYENTFMTNSFSPLISGATHSRQHCRTTSIDNIFTNSNPSDILVSGQLEPLKDHSPVFHISKSVQNNDSDALSNKVTMYYEYSKKNLERLVEVLPLRIATSNIENMDDFMAFYTGIVDECCKLTVPKTTKRNPISNPWISDGLITSIDHKHKLRRKWKKTCKKQEGGDPTLWKKFVAYQDDVNKLIGIAKSKYYYSKFEKYESNRKKTWEVINELRGKAKNKMNNVFSIDNERVVNRRVIADKFNTYFANLAKNLNTEAYKEKPHSEYPHFQEYIPNFFDKSIFLEECSSEEVTAIIKNFENGKASDIPVSVIKRTAFFISPMLCKLYNDCMKSGVFPSCLKVGKITPIFKKGDRELLKNYRPVSTLPIFGKIFEKIICSRIYNFFSCNNLLSDCQFGYRKKHSTGHAIHHSVNIIKDALADKKHVVAVFVDLSKAFDTIEHKILLSKLERYGIRGTANNLIKDYLSNRTQYVSTLGENSDLEELIYGVPQGSVLGPLLFLIYMNDIVNCINDKLNIKLVLYADDTNIFVIEQSRALAIQKANVVLSEINQFMKSNLLHINIDKCCFIHFNPQKESPNTDNNAKVYIAGKLINEVHQARFLGVIIDSKLSWEPHITKLHKKLNSQVGILKRICKNIPKKHHKSLYYSLFESHLSYCISVFGRAPKYNLEKLFIAQKKCIRVLFGDYEAYINKFKTCARTRGIRNQRLDASHYIKEHTKPLFSEHKLLASYNIYNYHTCIETAKILILKEPHKLHEAYTSSKRKNENLLILRGNHDQYPNPQSRLWNEVVKKVLKPDEDVNEISLSCLKTLIKNLFLKNQSSIDPVEWYPQNFCP